MVHNMFAICFTFKRHVFEQHVLILLVYCFYRQVPPTLSPNVILNWARIQSQVALHHLQSLKLWLSGLSILTTVLFYSPISHFTHFSLSFLPNLLHTPADPSLFL